MKEKDGQGSRVMLKNYHAMSIMRGLVVNIPLGHKPSGCLEIRVFISTVSLSFHSLRKIVTEPENNQATERIILILFFPIYFFVTSEWFGPIPRSITIQSFKR